MSTIGSATPVRYVLVASTCASQAIPARVSATPATSGGASPNRRATRGKAVATAKLTTVIGRNPRPAWKAVKPRTPCMSRVVKKKKPIIAPR